MPFNKKTTLRARWSKKDRDILYEYPSSPDGHLLHWHFGVKRETFDHTATPTNTPWYDRIKYEPSLLEELDKRGYDISTLKFSIKKKVTP